jgi:hypothetical protein
MHKGKNKMRECLVACKEITAEQMVRLRELNAEVTFYHTSDDEKHGDPIAHCDCYLNNCSKNGKNI